MRTITPDDLVRATWFPFMHGYASDHSVYVYRCSLSPRLTREFKIYRGRKRELRLDGPSSDNDIVYRIDGVVVGSISILGRKPEADSAQLRFFLVDPQYQGRGAGKALLMASRTMRRWTLNFLATPEIVPTPNSYSRRISSNSSTLFLLFIEEASLARFCLRKPSVQRDQVGQIRAPKWANLECQTQL